MFASLGTNTKRERWRREGRRDFGSVSLTVTGMCPRHEQENPSTPRAQTGPLQQQEGQQRTQLQALAAGRCAGDVEVVSLMFSGKKEARSPVESGDGGEDGENPDQEKLLNSRVGE